MSVNKAPTSEPIKEATKSAGIEIGKTPKGEISLNLLSLPDHLINLENRNLPEPAKEVKKIDHGLIYLQELRGKQGNSTTPITKEQVQQQITGRDQDGNLIKGGGYEQAINQQIQVATTDNTLIEALTAEPVTKQPHNIDNNNLQANIIRTRTLKRIHNLMETNNPTTKKPYTFSEATIKIEEDTKHARQRIIDAQLNNQIRRIKAPESYTSGFQEEDNWQDWVKDTEKERNQATNQLGQLLLLQEANISVIRNSPNAAEYHLNQAWNRVIKPVQKGKFYFGLNEKISALYHLTCQVGGPDTPTELQAELTRNGINYILLPTPEKDTIPTSPTVEKVPIAPTPIRIQAKENNLSSITENLCTQEDLSELEAAVIDKEHIHWHPRALLLTDSHGLGFIGLEKRLRAEFPDAKSITVKPDGSAWVDDQEIPIYHGGDALDLNKSDKLTLEWGQRHGFTSKQEYLTALNNNAHPLHTNAINLQKIYLQIPQNLDQQFVRLENAREDYNISEAITIQRYALDHNRALLGNHEAMMISGMEGSDTNLLLWLCDTNLGETVFHNMTNNSLNTILKGFNLQSLNEKSINSIPEPDRTNLCKKLRSELDSSKKAKEHKNAILKKVKLYQFVNGDLQVHSSIDIDDDNNLIPPKSFINKDKYSSSKYSEFWENIKKLKGLEALDYLEDQIHQGNKAAIDFITYSGEQYTPSSTPSNLNPEPVKRGGIYARKDFHKKMENNGSKVMQQIEAQAVKKGLSSQPKYLFSGHTPTVGGKTIGEHLLCADDDKATLVRIDLTKGKDGKITSNIRAAHNFGQTQAITHQIT